MNIEIKHNISTDIVKEDIKNIIGKYSKYMCIEEVESLIQTEQMVKQMEFNALILEEQNLLLLKKLNVYKRAFKKANKKKNKLVLSWSKNYPSCFGRFIDMPIDICNRCSSKPVCIHRSITR